MEPEQILNSLRRAIKRRVESLAISVTSGGVDSMEKYQYMLGQARTYQYLLQEISNLLEEKEQKNERENVIDIKGSTKD